MDDAAASRLVAELMPVSVAVAGQGAAAAAARLADAGTDAVESRDGATDGQDLAILLAPTADAAPLVERLTAAIDRVLVVPGTDADVAPLFELFAERGFQPVLEYDARFLHPAAFLVDRHAVADEEGLAAFTDRLAPPEPPAPPPPDPAPELRAALAAATAALAAARDELAAWMPLRHWVEARARAAPARRRRLFPSRRRRQLEAEAAAIRAAAAFDPAWYIASQPDLAATGADPVAHYLAHAATADPGPWFDTAAYLQANPALDPLQENPLLHAIRHGHSR